MEVLKRMPRWTRRKQARPRELTSAALELFVERGYAATRLEDVAARAGVSKGTLYLYFAGKEELFKAVVREGLVPALERGEHLVTEHRGSAAELLRLLVQGWWEIIGNSPFGGIPKLMLSECRNFPQLGTFYYQEVIARGDRLLRKVLEFGIQRGEFRAVDLDHVTRLVIAPVVLLTIWRHSFDFCDSRHIEPQAYIAQHIDLLLNGLAAQGNRAKRSRDQRQINGRPRWVR